MRKFHHKQKLTEDGFAAIKFFLSKKMNQRQVADVTGYSNQVVSKVARVNSLDEYKRVYKQPPGNEYRDLRVAKSIRDALLDITLNGYDQAIQCDRTPGVHEKKFEDYLVSIFEQINSYDDVLWAYNEMRGAADLLMDWRKVFVDNDPNIDRRNEEYLIREQYEDY